MPYLCSSCVRCCQTNAVNINCAVSCTRGFWQVSCCSLYSVLSTVLHCYLLYCDAVPRCAMLCCAVMLCQGPDIGGHPSWNLRAKTPRWVTAGWWVAVATSRKHGSYTVRQGCMFDKPVVTVQCSCMLYTGSTPAG